SGWLVCPQKLGFSSARSRLSRPRMGSHVSSSSGSASADVSPTQPVAHSSTRCSSRKCRRVSSSMPESTEAFQAPAATLVLRQLVRLRRKKRLAQSEVARKMGVTRQQVYNIETGRQGHPSILTVERYARAIGARLVVVSR